MAGHRLKAGPVACPAGAYRSRGTLLHRTGLRINRTRVEIRAPRIVISNGPLPWPGKKKFEISDIRLVYNTMALRFKKTRRSKNIISFVVMAVTGNNQHIQLLKAASRENAEEIEKIIKAQLGLKPSAPPKTNKPKSN